MYISTPDRHYVPKLNSNKADFFNFSYFWYISLIIWQWLFIANWFLCQLIVAIFLISGEDVENYALRLSQQKRLPTILYNTLTLKLIELGSWKFHRLFQSDQHAVAISAS